MAPTDQPLVILELFDIRDSGDILWLGSINKEPEGAMVCGELSATLTNFRTTAMSRHATKETPDEDRQSERSHSAQHGRQLSQPEMVACFVRQDLHRRPAAAGFDVAGGARRRDERRGQ